MEESQSSSVLTPYSNSESDFSSFCNKYIISKSLIDDLDFLTDTKKEIMKLALLKNPLKLMLIRAALKKPMPKSAKVQKIQSILDATGSSSESEPENDSQNFGDSSSSESSFENINPNAWLSSTPFKNLQNRRKVRRKRRLIKRLSGQNRSRSNEKAIHKSAPIIININFSDDVSRFVLSE